MNNSGKPQFEDIRATIAYLDHQKEEGSSQSCQTTLTPSTSLHHYHPYQRPSPPRSVTPSPITPLVVPTIIRCSDMYEEAPTPCFATPEPLEAILENVEIEEEGQEDVAMADEGEDTISLGESMTAEELNSYARSHQISPKLKKHVDAMYDEEDQLDSEEEHKTEEHRRCKRYIKANRPHKIIRGKIVPWYEPSSLLLQSLSNSSTSQPQVDSTDSSSNIDCNYIEINESLLKSRDECDHKDFEKKF